MKIKWNIFLFILFTFFICGTITRAYSQSNKIDSLKKLLLSINQISSFKNDTTRINTITALAWEISNEKPDSSILLIKESFKIANVFLKKEGLDMATYLQQTNATIPDKQKWFVIAIAQNYHYLGEFNRLKGDFPSAIENSLKALTIWDKLNDKKLYSQKSATLANIGIFHSEQGDYTKALHFYESALQIDRSINDKNGIAADMGNMAIIYAEQNDYAKALEFFSKALKINEELGNKKGIASKLGNIGIIYKRQAEDLSQKEGAKQKSTIDSLYKKALEYFTKAQKLNEELGNKHGIAINLGNIGVLYFQTKNYKKAEECYFKALEIDSLIGFKSHEVDLYKTIYQFYDSTKNVQSAYLYYRKYIAGRDSLNNENNVKKMLETQFKYEFDKREIEQKAEQEKKDVITAQEKKRQRVIIYSISCVSVLLIFLVAFVFKSYKQKQRSNIEIMQQKQLVEEKQKEILDSIRYAKRIQTSILPHDNYITKSLKKLNNNS